MTATVKKAELPPLLAPGDTIGLAPLAGPHQETDFHRGATILRDLGFRHKTLQPERALPFLAGSDQERLEIFHTLWRDPEIKAIMAVRGGYGTLRLLAHLDYGLLRERPKTLIGFSDISGLLNVVNERTGLITLHGPNLTTLAHSDTESLTSLTHCLSRALPPDLRPAGLEVIRAGRAEGVLVGGNLTTLTHLLSTPFELRWAGKILFLEDVGEAPYRIDRLLSQLALAGAFRHLAGLILGTFSQCGAQEEIWQRLAELGADYDFPIWGNFPVGHGSRNVTLAIGAGVVMDSNQAMLRWTTPCHRS